MATLVLLEVYVKLPASAGVKVAPESTTSPTFKSTVELATVMLVGLLVLVKLKVYDTVSNLPVTVAFPTFLAVYVIFSPINAEVLFSFPSVCDKVKLTFIFDAS